MKNLFFLATLFLFPTACHDKMDAADQPVQKDSIGKKINGLSDSDATLSYNKKTHPGKDAGCRNYHKKRYE
jgi:hypothetical protein